MLGGHDMLAYLAMIAPRLVELSSRRLCYQGDRR